MQGNGMSQANMSEMRRNTAGMYSQGGGQQQWDNNGIEMQENQIDENRME